MQSSKTERALIMLLPKLQVSFNYVLIIEWLHQDDRPTGADLHTFLQNVPMSTCLVRCSAADDVRRVLEHACTNVRTRGIPVVHIESHGSDPFSVKDVRDADFGAIAAPGLPWTELGDWLAPLNAASGFRLLVVGAACWGFAAIAAMKVQKHVAPFAAAIGFSTSVCDASLHDAMKELYRSIARADELGVAVANAQREVRHADEKIRYTSSPLLALKILRGAYDGIRTDDLRTARAQEILRQLREKGAEVPQDKQDALPEVLLERGEAQIRGVWDGWFPSSIQRSQPAYQFDWDLIQRADFES